MIDQASYSHPAGLTGFFGNEHAKQTLITMANDGRLSHALLLTGEPGTGKRTFAKLCAAALLCEHPSQKPCGQCRHCRKVLSGIHPDVIFTDCQEGSGQFPVEKLRELLGGVYVAPNEAARKVYILANCHNLSPQGPHTLLKTLEEPPETAAFVLTCPSRGLLLPTVLSRVVEIPLHPLSQEETLLALSRRFPQKAEKEREQAALLSFGCLGRAEALLEDGQGEQAGQAEELYEKACAAAKALSQNSEYPLLCLLSLLEKEQLTRVMELLRRCARDALEARLEQRAPRGEVTAALAGLTASQLAGVCEVLSQGLEAQRRNAGRTLLPAYLCQGLMTARNQDG